MRPSTTEPFGRFLLLTAITVTGCGSPRPVGSDGQRTDGPLDLDTQQAEAAADGPKSDRVGKGPKVAFLLLEGAQNVGGLLAFDPVMGTELATFSVSLNGGDFDMPADGSRLVLANGESGELHVFGVWQGKSVNFVPENMVDVGHASRQLALHPTKDTAYVQVYDKIVPVDLKTMKAGSTIWEGSDGITEIGVSSGGDRALISTWMSGGALYSVDPQTAQTAYSVANLGSISTFALSRDDMFAYCIVKWGNDLEVVKLDSNPRMIAKLPLPYHPVGLVVTHDNKELVAHGGVHIVRYPIKNGVPQAPGTTIALSCSQTPQDNERLPVAISTDDRLVVAACRGEAKVALVDLEIGKESGVQSIASGTQVLGVQIRNAPE